MHWTRRATAFQSGPSSSGCDVHVLWGLLVTTMDTGTDDELANGARPVFSSVTAFPKVLDALLTCKLGFSMSVVGPKTFLSSKFTDNERPEVGHLCVFKHYK